MNKETIDYEDLKLYIGDALIRHGIHEFDICGDMDIAPFQLIMRCLDRCRDDRITVVPPVSANDCTPDPFLGAI